MIFLSFSFLRGGAAKAASRFSELAKSFTKIEKISADESRGFTYLFHYLKRLISFALVFPFYQFHQTKCSANIFSYKPVLKSFSDKRIFNFHWINNDTLSVFDFKKIPINSIITLHDEWMYCSIEHYFNINDDYDSSAYVVDDEKYHHYSFFHRYIWNKKKRAFSNRKDLIITCPSTWLADRARKSMILRNCDIRVLPNPVNTQIFLPLSKTIIDAKRKEKNIENKFVFIFGAINGTKNPIKGFDKLLEALKILSENEKLKKQIVLGLFGGAPKGLKDLYGFPVKEFGYISSETEMAELYSLANVTLVPSLVESFGQVAAESQSCGTPVIAFQTSGLCDVVQHQVTGMLAEAFSPASFARQMKAMVLLSTKEYEEMRVNARDYIINNFSYPVITEKYSAIIAEQLLKTRE